MMNWQWKSLAHLSNADLYEVLAARQKGILLEQE